MSGNYEDAGTFKVLGEALGDARHPVFYFAIPPALFETVVGRLRDAGLHEDGRVVVEKPFGRDLASARHLDRCLRTSASPPATPASTSPASRRPLA